jgi:hypothetical protein
MFGLFKKKPPTVMDGMIRMIYGANPPPKSADLERSITNAHEDLLFEKVPLAEVKQRASELFKGLIPYSTHDLAVSTALAFFKSPEYVSVLQECEISARLRVVNWTTDGKVVKPLAESFDEVLKRVYQPNTSATPKGPTTNKEIVSLINDLLTVQLTPRYQRPRDAFSTLMTNKLAAGYVFGFQDCCFQTFGRIDRNDYKGGLSVMQEGYQYIFGDQAGYALFRMSIACQKDSDFQIGRQSGGEEYMEFIKQKTPPLGLGRILELGFDAAAVWRTLDRNWTQPNEANNQRTYKPEQEADETQETAEKAPDASDDDDRGFKNTFGKSYGTDHLLKMGWQSYFASIFPPGAKDVPKVGTVGYWYFEMSWYAGVMMSLENIRNLRETRNSASNVETAGAIIWGSVDRLWREHHTDEEDDHLFNERKAAFAAGCWFINMAMVSMAKDPDRNKFHQNLVAIQNELADYAEKMTKK